MHEPSIVPSLALPLSLGSLSHSLPTTVLKRGEIVSHGSKNAHRRCFLIAFHYLSYVKTHEQQVLKRLNEYGMCTSATASYVVDVPPPRTEKQILCRQYPHRRVGRRRDTSRKGVLNSHMVLRAVFFFFEFTGLSYRAFVFNNSVS